MSKKLFVGNLDWGITGDDLRELFAQHGQLEDAVVISDKMTGRSKGFGFVTFANDEDGDKAVQALDGQDYKGRNLTVNVARPPKQY